MSDRFLDMGWLKANCCKLHYFGLGFIQLKIDAALRMHFYAPELPPITGPDDIHNHRYSFGSEILSGQLCQEIFDVVDGDTHILENENCKEGCESLVGGTSCGILFNAKHCYGPGSYYAISHSIFHRVQATNCITLLTRAKPVKEFAQVVRPAGEAKVCPFSKKIDPEELWKIVERMVKEASGAN